MKVTNRIILISCSGFVFTIFLFLYASSAFQNDIYRGDFTRYFVNGPELSAARIVDLKYPYYYLSGVHGSHIYLGNRATPFSLLKTDLALTYFRKISLKAPDIAHEKVKSPGMFRVVVDSPNFFIQHGPMAKLLRGVIGNWEASTFMPDTGYYFVEAIPFSSSSFVLRSYSVREGGYELAKKTSIDSPFFKFNYEVLQKQIDGVFCVEGMLHYSKKLNRVIYLYTYRNQYAVMDTFLTVLSRGNTIDPFQQAQLETVSVESSNTLMLTGPVSRINERSCVFGEFLYVQSNVLGSNDDVKKVLHGCVIDVYDLNKKTGNYLYSFYLDDYLNHKITDFRVTDGKMVALYDSYLVVFQMPVRDPNHD
jgi:hypothetical protein